MPTERNRDYSYLLTVFSEDKIRSRHEMLTEAVKAFIAANALGEFVSYSQCIIDEIVLDYFADIERLKAFHMIERANPRKVAAYTGYWVARKKPLYLREDPSDELLREHPYILEVNEWFSFFVMLSMAFDIRHPELKDTKILGAWRRFNKDIH